MKRGGGKSKGSAFERQVCKDLSLWVTNGQKDDCFWRSAMSGGRATVQHRKGQDLSHVSGDICATHPDGYPLIENWFIECKFYKDLGFKTLVTSGRGVVADFWGKACDQAQQHMKRPMLILKQNQLPALVGIDAAYLSGTHGHLLPVAGFPKLGLYLYDYSQFLLRPGSWPKPKKQATIKRKKLI